MANSEPEFQVSERAVPAEYLNYNCKDESGNVYNFRHKISNTKNRSDDKKDDPEEMNEDNNVSKNIEKHRIIIVSHHCRFYEKSF
jgi:hypothetical protein